MIKVMNSWPNEFHLMLLICFLSSFRYNSAPAAKAIKPAIRELVKMKCKKIILGCTELPIAIFAFKSFSNVKSSKIFLDPNLILANSAMSKHKS